MVNQSQFFQALESPPAQPPSLGRPEQVVKMLLGMQGGDYGRALHVASAKGLEEVVKILLDKDADVNAQGGYYGNALQAASFGGHEQVVKMLLDKDADVNAQGGYYGKALQAASAEGYEQIVKMLLDSMSDYGHGQKRCASNAYETETRLKKSRACVLQAPNNTYETRQHIPQQAAPTTIHSAEPWEALIQSHEKLIADLELKVERQSVVLNHIMMSTGKEEIKAVFALRFCQTLRGDAENWLQQFNVRHGTQFDMLWNQLALEDAPETFYWSSWGERMVKICQIWHFLSFPDCNHEHDQSHSGPLCKECSSHDCKPICSKAPFHVFMGMLKDHCDICHKDFVGLRAQENRQDCKNSHYDTRREVQYPNNNFQPCRTCVKLEWQNRQRALPV